MFMYLKYELYNDSNLFQPIFLGFKNKQNFTFLHTCVVWPFIPLNKKKSFINSTISLLFVFFFILYNWIREIHCTVDFNITGILAKSALYKLNLIFKFIVTTIKFSNWWI